ncbi:hypothetical protein FRC19_008537 [Serendipita sp. 401]|nr:hypothetical protein FRC19_008537 [Serendipita sp. 401]KAG9052699.1 hypothetical protein FS842_009385 [Serendipita sp. 407]
MSLGFFFKRKSSRISRNNTTNPRVGHEFTRRVADIASDLDGMDDKERAELLKTIVAEVSDNFQSPAQDSLTQCLEPLLFAKRQEVLIRADEKLDQIKPPSPERKVTMQTASKHDFESLEMENKGSLEISADNFQSILQLLPVTTDADSRTLTRLREDQSSLVRLQTFIQGVYERVKVLQEGGILEKNFIIKIIRLDEPSQAAKHQHISPDRTSGELFYDLDKPEEGSLSEIWLKKVTPSATESDTQWEEQDIAHAIVDALRDRGIKEDIVKLGVVWRKDDYVAVLTQDNGVEGRRPEPRDVDSDSGSSSSANYRVIGVVGKGALDLPCSQLAITPEMTYGDLNVYFNQLAPNRRPEVLVPTFGPYPIFRYVSPSKPVSPSVRRLFVIDRNEFNSVVVVRTVDEDVVVPITLSKEDNQLTMADVIRAHISALGYLPISIKDYSGQSDIGSQSLETTRASSQKAHPTIAFVETQSGNGSSPLIVTVTKCQRVEGYDFRAQFRDDINIAESLEVLFARGGALIQKASQVDIRLFHLARAMVHLIISAQEALSIDWTLGIEHCKDLHCILDGLEDRLDSGVYSESALMQDFYGLCGDRPGAVAVRHSYAAFSKLNTIAPAPLDRQYQSLVARGTLWHADNSTMSSQIEEDNHHHRKALSYPTELPLATVQERPNPVAQEASNSTRKDYGFIELSPGQNPIVDIIAIHGLDGHREQSWTAEGGTMWLKDLLSGDIPNARILSYGYDADTRSFSRTPTQSIFHHAEELVEDLSRLRRAADPKRPIIFLAHSLGGIILKKALTLCYGVDFETGYHLRDIFISTFAILFFGTPQSGANSVQLAELMGRVVSICMSTNDQVLKALNRDSSELENIQKMYSEVGRWINTIFFYEEYATPIVRGMEELVSDPETVNPITS